MAKATVVTLGDLRRVARADLRGGAARDYLTRPTKRFVLALRLTEFVVNSQAPRALKVAARMVLRRYGRSFGFTVPPNVCGPGLSLVHWGSVVISPLARIGSGVVIHSDVNIGHKDGEAPTIGDGCFIGPGAKLFGGIELGEGCRVGANAVVNRSWPAGSVLAGVPAKPVGASAPC